MDLKGKVVVVTGASAGLGRAFARKLTARGSRVYGLARSEAKLAALHRELGELFVPLRCNVTSEDQITEIFAALSADPGRVDALINNAGLGRFGPIKTLDSKSWALQVDTNLTGVFFCTRAVIPLMQAQNARTGFGGHIVNIASIAGIIGNANISAYNATKFGLRGFSEGPDEGASLRRHQGDQRVPWLRTNRFRPPCRQQRCPQPDATRGHCGYGHSYP